MNTLFGFSVILMNRLKYAQKFLLIFILFMIPLTTALSLLLKNYQDVIRFTEKEIAGIEYTPKILALIQYVQQHRGKMSNLIGGKPVQDQLHKIDINIQKTITEITAIDQTHNSHLNSSEGSQATNADLAKLLKEKSTFTLDDSFNRHTAIIQTLLQQMTYIGDQSNLRIEPQMERFYVIDAALYKLPLLAEAMGKARGLGSGILSTKKMSATQKETLGLLLAIIQDQISSAEYGKLSLRKQTRR